MSDIKTVEQLESLYGTVHPAAVTKEIDYISDHYRAYIEAAPLMVIASAGEGGLDCSPRGDPAGSFVKVFDRKTLLIPDRPGNNRIDTLRNIVAEPRVALLFLLPGIGITVRVNGRAAITTRKDLLELFSNNGKLPIAVIRVAVDAAYFQCPKALIRARAWNPDFFVDSASLPSAGTMLQTLDAEFDGESFDDNYPERIKQTIY